MKRDSIDISNVTIVPEGGNILEDLKEIAPPTWPEIVHVQSLMGCESPVIIWITSGNYYDRQVEIFM